MTDKKIWRILDAYRAKKKVTTRFESQSLGVGCMYEPKSLEELLGIIVKAVPLGATIEIDGVEVVE
jgi:hypothetical protein